MVKRRGWWLLLLMSLDTLRPAKADGTAPAPRGVRWLIVLMILAALLSLGTLALLPFLLL